MVFVFIEICNTWGINKGIIYTDSTNVFCNPDIKSKIVEVKPYGSICEIYKTAITSDLQNSLIIWVCISKNDDKWINFTDIAIVPIHYYEGSIKLGLLKQQYFIIEDIKDRNNIECIMWDYNKLDNKFPEIKSTLSIDRLELRNNRFIHLDNFIKCILNTDFINSIKQPCKKQIDNDLKCITYNSTYNNIVESFAYSNDPFITGLRIMNPNIELPYKIKLGISNADVLNVFGSPIVFEEDKVIYEIALSQDSTYEITFAFKNYYLSSIDVELLY
jgi:hypothetical protein